MRLDKYLKTARILKRREAAKELALQKRIKVNDRIAKPSTELEIGDVIEIQFGQRIVVIRVLDIQKQVSKQNAQLLFEIIREEKIEENIENE
ncbi:S4 domain-containing protein [Floccifex sp.]|uniref:S4 domain-containing protein n=1 Tax=Floccifex sp. TaxID=2815810 RepID=UPI002A757D09|nr:S4 domain-containing protein [Floccifex sp.]MDD7280568.1 S4 domain-containing protein [Erysipelotrichaceae bacterium]MDY2958635.1 S4 domain-containing protein [Floccifex sp.]